MCRSVLILACLCFGTWQNKDSIYSQTKPIEEVNENGEA